MRIKFTDAQLKDFAIKSNYIDLRLIITGSEIHKSAKLLLNLQEEVTVRTKTLNFGDFMIHSVKFGSDGDAEIQLKADYDDVAKFSVEQAIILKQSGTFQLIMESSKGDEEDDE